MPAAFRTSAAALGGGWGIDEFLFTPSCGAPSHDSPPASLSSSLSARSQPAASSSWGDCFGDVGACVCVRKKGTSVFLLSRASIVFCKGEGIHARVIPPGLHRWLASRAPGSSPPDPPFCLRKSRGERARREGGRFLSACPARKKERVSVAPPLVSSSSRRQKRGGAKQGPLRMRARSCSGLAMMRRWDCRRARGFWCVREGGTEGKDEVMRRHGRRALFFATMRPARHHPFFLLSLFSIIIFIAQFTEEEGKNVRPHLI